MHSFPAKYLASLGLSLGLLAAACQAATAPVSPLPPAKIAPPVTLAAQALLRGAPSSAHTDAQGRLQVYVYVTELSLDCLDKLGHAGLVEPQSNPEMSLVQGWIAPRDLGPVAALDCVKEITLPRYGSPR